MNDPIAFFITISTYGTWLPGDQRGWVEYNKGWQMPDPIRELEASAKMTENARILSLRQREIVMKQVHQTCEHRAWTCYAVNCRTNHMHAVVGALNTPPKKIRVDLKAWCTRRLKEEVAPQITYNWWAERGSIRWVFDEEGLDKVIYYTLEGQHRKPEA